MDTIWLETVLIFVAILVNGFFAGSEIALVSARTARLTHLRDESLRGAAAALSLKADPETFLATIQIAITLVGTLASAVGGATAIEALTPWLAGLPLVPVKNLLGLICAILQRVVGGLGLRRQARLRSGSPRTASAVPRSATGHTPTRCGAG